MRHQDFIRGWRKRKGVNVLERAQLSRHLIAFQRNALRQFANQRHPSGFQNVVVHRESNVNHVEPDDTPVQYGREHL